MAKKNMKNVFTKNLTRAFPSLLNYDLAKLDTKGPSSAIFWNLVYFSRFFFFLFVNTSLGIRWVEREISLQRLFINNAKHNDSTYHLLMLH